MHYKRIRVKSTLKQAITAVLVCIVYYICSAVPQFNIRSSNAAGYKHTDVTYDVLFTFSAEKKRRKGL